MKERAEGEEARRHKTMPMSNDANIHTHKTKKTYTPNRFYAHAHPRTPPHTHTHPPTNPEEKAKATTKKTATCGRLQQACTGEDRGDSGMIEDHARGATPPMRSALAHNVGQIGSPPRGHER